MISKFTPQKTTGSRGGLGEKSSDARKITSQEAFQHSKEFYMTLPTAPSHPKGEKSGLKLNNCDTLSSSDVVRILSLYNVEEWKIFY